MDNMELSEDLARRISSPSQEEPLINLDLQSLQQNNDLILKKTTRAIQKTLGNLGKNPRARQKTSGQNTRARKTSGQNTRARKKTSRNHVNKREANYGIVREATYGEVISRVERKSWVSNLLFRHACWLNAFRIRFAVSIAPEYQQSSATTCLCWNRSWFWNKCFHLHRSQSRNARVARQIQCLSAL